MKQPNDTHGHRQDHYHAQDHDHEPKAADHGHAHAHGGHGHGHHHAPAPGRGRSFAIAVALNVAIVVVQGVYGLIAKSTALLADAGHNLSDVLGLLLAWGAIWLATRRPSARYTFGLRSSSILASLANAALLLFACGAIAWEAIDRLMHPAPVAGLIVFAVALTGVVVNGFSAWLFMGGSKGDLNIRGAYLHMASDAAISAAVAVSGLTILYTGWTWVDPLMSLAVVAMVVLGTWGLLCESVRLCLGAVPADIATQPIKDYFGALPGVASFHDLHIWGLSTTENSLTVHLVMPDGHPGDVFLDDVVATLEERFAIHHVTIQVDLGTTSHACSLEAAHS